MKIKSVAFIFALITVAVFSTSFCVKASADMGPKPKVIVSFSSLPEQEIYVTLLSKTSVSGPHRASGDHEEPDQIDQKFASYCDADGYYYLYYYNKIIESEPFVWGYWPPSQFKILVYMQQSNSFVISEKLERYAFSSYFTASILDDNILTEKTLEVKQSYDYFGEICKLILRIAFTLAVELGIAKLFGYRKKSFIVILIANLVTQISFNVGLNLINYTDGWMSMLFAYFGFELLIFLAESIFYMIAIPKIDEKCPTKLKRFWVLLLYALAANLASFLLGAAYLILVGI